MHAGEKTSDNNNKFHFTELGEGRLPSLSVTRKGWCLALVNPQCCQMRRRPRKGNGAACSSQRWRDAGKRTRMVRAINIHIRMAWTEFQTWQQHRCTSVCINMCKQVSTSPTPEHPTCCMPSIVAPHTTKHMTFCDDSRVPECVKTQAFAHVHILWPINTI